MTGYTTLCLIKLQRLQNILQDDRRKQEEELKEEELSVGFLEQIKNDLKTTIFRLTTSLLKLTAPVQRISFSENRSSVALTSKKSFPGLGSIYERFGSYCLIPSYEPKSGTKFQKNTALDSVWERPKKRIRNHYLSLGDFSSLVTPASTIKKQRPDLPFSLLTKCMTSRNRAQGEQSKEVLFGGSRTRIKICKTSRG